MSVQLPRSERKGAGARLQRLSQAFGDQVTAHPIFSRQSPEQRLQRWHFAPEYLAKYGEEREWDVVPTDSPLFFEGVRNLAWYANHPHRKGKRAASEGSSENEEQDGTQGDEEAVGGLDDGRRRSRGGSSVKKKQRPSTSPSALSQSSMSAFQATIGASSSSATTQTADQMLADLKRGLAVIAEDEELEEGFFSAD